MRIIAESTCASLTLPRRYGIPGGVDGRTGEGSDGARRRPGGHHHLLMSRPETPALGVFSDSGRGGSRGARRTCTVSDFNYSHNKPKRNAEP